MCGHGIFGLGSHAVGPGTCARYGYGVRWRCPACQAQEALSKLQALAQAALSKAQAAVKKMKAAKETKTAKRDM